MVVLQGMLRHPPLHLQLELRVYLLPLQEYLLLELEVLLLNKQQKVFIIKLLHIKLHRTLHKQEI